MPGNVNYRKSRIAIEYCYRYRARHPDGHVFWVHASNHARFQGGYDDIARELALPNHSREDPLQLISRWLNTDANGPWLMILDNADDSDTFFRSSPLQQAAPLVEYIPKSSHGSIIITTRDMRVGEKLAHRVKPISVLPLAVVEAQGLLRSKCHRGDEEKIGDEALELLEILNYLPLAITQAAAFINENGISVADYVEMLKASVSDIHDLLEEDLHDAGRDTEIQNSVFQTWKISYDYIQKQKPRAAEILAIMSLLDRQAIPAELLRHDNERKVDFVTAIGMLKAFSLISEEKNQSVFGIHRLVQLSIQRWLAIRKQLVSWQEKALEVVAKCCPLHGDYEEWTSWSRISAHCHVVLDYDIKTCLHLRAEILSKFGSYDEEQGRYEDAKRKFTEALAIGNDLLGKHHSTTLMCISHLTTIYRYQGRFAEAEEMGSYLVQTQKQLLGSKHPLTLAAMNNLAIIYNATNRHVEAEGLHRHVLDTRKRLEGGESDGVLTSMHNIAHSMKDQGRLKKAEGMIEQFIKLSSTVRGPEHPKTLRGIRLLGLIYQDQGLWGKAAELHFQGYETRRKTLGLEHPDTLRSMLTVAEVYQLQPQPQLEAAEELQLHVMKKRELTLGDEHPETLSVAKCLALTYVYQRRWEKAASLNANILEIEKRVLRPDHQATIATMHIIAFAYLRQGRWQEAANLGMQVVEARTRLLGQGDPQTLSSKRNLAEAYIGLNRVEDALDLMVAVATGKTKTLGVGHSDTQLSTNLVQELTRMRENPTQPTPDPRAGIKTDMTSPEATDGSKQPIPSSQSQLPGLPRQASESSSELHRNSGNNRKETMPVSPGGPSEQTLHVPEDLHTLASASDIMAE